MKSLRMKILGGFAIVISLLLVLSVVSYIQTNKFKGQVEDVLENKVDELIAWEELNYTIARATSSLRGYLLTGDQTYYDEFFGLADRAQTSKDRVAELEVTSEQAAVLEKNQVWDEQVKEIFNVYKINPEQAVSKAVEVRVLTRELYNDYDGIVNQTRENVNDLKDQIYKSGNSLIMITVSISIFGLVLGTLIAFFLAQKITRPILEISNRTKRIAAGDLSGEALVTKSKDEVGELVKSTNEMILSLRHVIGQVAENAANLAASSEEISASTEQMASGSQQQATDAASSSEMVKEVASAIRNVSVNAEAASNATEKTVQAAVEGGRVIRETVAGMEEISQKIGELSSKSVQIGEIVEVIDDIAEQTNLLALNAAIEAARAGDAGKGFAVVADEVRKLAERSSKATKEISELIHSIQQNTDDSVAAVTAGNETVTIAGETFGQIVKLLKESASKVAEIAAAGEEVTAQSNEVLIAVENIASVSEETAAGIQQTATTANDLAKMAESLTQLSAKFKL